MRTLRNAILVLAALAVVGWWNQHDGARLSPGEAGAPTGMGTQDAGPPPAPAGLPPEAVQTLAIIERGGPFPYSRDGIVFQNRERRLPERPRGYYREYTVPTPGESDRGARRIVTGGDPPEVWYYTDDHYRSFRRLEIPR